MSPCYSSLTLINLNQPLQQKVPIVTYLLRHLETIPQYTFSLTNLNALKDTYLDIYKRFENHINALKTFLGYTTIPRNFRVIFKKKKIMRGTFYP